MKNIIALALLFFVSHSYAVKFHSYVNDKGETVCSNVPADCIENSVLTCLRYHPVMSAQPPAVTPSPQTKSGTTKRPIGTDSVFNDFKHTPGNKGNDLQLDILDRIVGINALINQYYPGRPDPSKVKEVRNQQENILQTLHMIRNTANREEKPAIERAIQILRSNLAQ